MYSKEITLLVFVFIFNNACGYLRVCYYTNWSQYRPNGGKFTPDNVDPALCSHIIFAFGKLVGNTIIPFEWNDESTEWSTGMYAKINQLKTRQPGLKTLLAIGGWNAGSLIFSDMVKTKASRKEFINSTLVFLRKRNFNGLDMDWEYPGMRGGRPEDKRNLVALLSELSAAFEQDTFQTGLERLLLTAAVPAGKSNIDAGYDIPNVVRSLDFINIMTYDMHGSWENRTGHNSPLYGRAGENPEDAMLNMDWSVKYWLQNGAPKHKLIIGFGLYGRSFQLKSAIDNEIGSFAIGAGRAGKYTREAGFMAYYEVCEELKHGAVRRWHPEQKIPYIVKDDLWVGYDDEESIREKINWLKLNNFGGVMVWSLALDDFTGQFCNKGPYPLLNIINNELNNLPTPAKPAPVIINNGLNNIPTQTKPAPVIINNGPNNIPTQTKPASVIRNNGLNNVPKQTKPAPAIIPQQPQIPDVVVQPTLSAANKDIVRAIGNMIASNIVNGQSSVKLTQPANPKTQQFTRNGMNIVSNVPIAIEPAVATPAVATPVPTIQSLPIVVKPTTMIPVAPAPLNNIPVHSTSLNSHTGHSPNPSLNSHTGHSPSTSLNSHTGHSPSPSLNSHTGHSPSTSLNSHTGHSPSPSLNSHTGHSPSTSLNSHTGHSPNPSLNSHTGHSPNPSLNSHTGHSPSTSLSSHTGHNPTHVNSHKNSISDFRFIEPVVVAQPHALNEKPVSQQANTLASNTLVGQPIGQPPISSSSHTNPTNIASKIVPAELVSNSHSLQPLTSVKSAPPSPAVVDNVHGPTHSPRAPSHTFHGGIPSNIPTDILVSILANLTNNNPMQPISISLPHDIQPASPAQHQPGVSPIGQTVSHGAALGGAANSALTNPPSSIIDAKLLQAITNQGNWPNTIMPALPVLPAAVHDFPINQVPIGVDHTIAVNPQLVQNRNIGPIAVSAVEPPFMSANAVDIVPNIPQQVPAMMVPPVRNTNSPFGNANIFNQQSVWPNIPQQVPAMIVPPVQRVNSAFGNANIRNEQPVFPVDRIVPNNQVVPQVIAAPVVQPTVPVFINSPMLPAAAPGILPPITNTRNRASSSSSRSNSPLNFSFSSSSKSNSNSSSSSSNSSSSNRNINLGSLPSIGASRRNSLDDILRGGSLEVITLPDSRNRLSPTAAPRRTSPQENAILSSILSGNTAVPVSSNVNIPSSNTVGKVIPVDSLGSLAEILANFSVPLDQGSILLPDRVNGFTPEQMLGELSLTNILRSPTQNIVPQSRPARRRVPSQRPTSRLPAASLRRRNFRIPSIADLQIQSRNRQQLPQIRNQLRNRQRQTSITVPQTNRRLPQRNRRLPQRNIRRRLPQTNTRRLPQTNTRSRQTNTRSTQRNRRLPNRTTVRQRSQQGQRPRQQFNSNRIQAAQRPFTRRPQRNLTTRVPQRRPTASPVVSTRQRIPRTGIIPNLRSTTGAQRRRRVQTIPNLNNNRFARQRQTQSRPQFIQTPRRTNRNRVMVIGSSPLTSGQTDTIRRINNNRINQGRTRTNTGTNNRNNRISSRIITI